MKIKVSSDPELLKCIKELTSKLENFAELNDLMPSLTFNMNKITKKDKNGITYIYRAECESHISSREYL